MTVVTTKFPINGITGQLAAIVAGSFVAGSSGTRDADTRRYECCDEVCLDLCPNMATRFSLPLLAR